MVVGSKHWLIAKKLGRIVAALLGMGKLWWYALVGALAFWDVMEQSNGKSLVRRDLHSLLCRLLERAIFYCQFWSITGHSK